MIDLKQQVSRGAVALVLTLAAIVLWFDVGRFVLIDRFVFRQPTALLCVGGAIAVIGGLLLPRVLRWMQVGLCAALIVASLVFAALVSLGSVFGSSRIDRSYPVGSSGDRVDVRRSLWPVGHVCETFEFVHGTFPFQRVHPLNANRFDHLVVTTDC
jgi:hypothetical protein